MSAASLIAAHHRAGRFFESGGLRAFVHDVGSGPPIVLCHGVPASSFSYRKVARVLAAAGHRVIAIDLPGLGFSERPVDFDYSWSGLGSWVRMAIDDLGLDRYHLVVHDLGGPVGFEALADDPGRAMSLTMLNTMLAVDGFQKPWVMRPFESTVAGRPWLSMMRPFTFLRLMRLMGVADQRISDDELLAYLDQLRWLDGGRAFLEIMRGFEPTEAKQQRFVGAVTSIEHRQLIWGDLDPALRFDTVGRATAAAAKLDDIHRLAAKHFVQEEQAPEVASMILRLALTAQA